MSGIGRQKRFLLAAALITSLGWGAEECGVFMDVLQTRNPGSIIDVEGEAKIISTSDNGCELNTTDIQQGIWWNRLECGNSYAQPTGVPANGLDVDYNFTAEPANTSATPCSDSGGECGAYSAVSGDNVLPNAGYYSVQQPNGGATFHFTANGDKYIDRIDLTVDQDTNLSFENQGGAQLAIGTLTSTGSGSLYLSLDAPASTIKIDTLSFNNYTEMNLEATDTIEINNLKFPRYNSVLVLKAPKLIVNNFTQYNAGDNNSKVIIYADEVDINGTLDLGQQAILEVHPYTPGKRVLFKAGKMTASSSSTMVVDSGDYYTNEFSIPGTDNSVSIRASDAQQVINLYINGDFAPGNNPGMNTRSHEVNSFNLPAANFRMFVNGDFVIGDGGTSFNGLFYVEKSATLGTEVILNGALSSGDNLSVEENDQFGWDNSIDNLGNTLCATPTEEYTYYNKYYCGIFDSPLVSWGKINLKGQNRYRLRYTYRIRTQEMNGNYACYRDNATEVECQILEPPTNRLYYENMYTAEGGADQTYTSDVNLTDRTYGDLVFAEGANNVVFDPQNGYSNKPDIHMMMAEDVNFTGTDQNWTIEAGDYFFSSLNMANEVNVCVEGPVRIFLKGDLNWKGRFNNECSGELFIYVGGNSYITTYDTLPQTPTYVYTKGDTEVYKDPNSEIGYWYGALASEGDINVEDDDIEFVYDSDGAELLGYGDCKICYGEIKSSGFGVSMPFMSAGVLEEIITPIYASSTLQDVKIEELHNSSIFNFTFGDDYEVIDQDGNTVRPATEETNGFLASAMGMDITLFGNKAVLYELGDTNYTYGPTTPTNYQQLYSKYLFSFDFGAWKDSLVYLGSYTDTQGREYQLVVNPCGPRVADSVEPTTGFFDAWDDNYQYSKITPTYDASGIPNTRIITTKVYHEKGGFTLDVAFIPNPPAVPSSDGIIEADLALVKVTNGTFDPHNDLISDWGYYKFNPANPVVKYTFDYGVTTSGNTVNLKDLGAISDVRVLFKVCADYDGAKYTVYPLESCAEVGDCSNNGVQDNVCYRYFTSSDDFAIRPYGLRLFGDNLYRRAGEDFNLTLKAVDEDGYLLTSGTSADVRGVPQFNLPLANLQFTPSQYKATDTEKNQMRTDMGLPADAEVDYCPDQGTFALSNTGDAFLDGTATVTLNYNEVGILDLNVSEGAGKEFAIVDEDDTIDSRRYLAPAVGISDNDNIGEKDLLLFIPYQFTTTGKLSTTTGLDWIYISRDVNKSNEAILNGQVYTPRMAGVIEYNITALNKQGEVLKNYTKTCFPDFTTSAPTRNGLKLNVTFDLFMDTDLNLSAPVKGANFYVTDLNNNPIWTLTKTQDLAAGKNQVREWISSLNFENGVGGAKIYFNQYKIYNQPVTPIDVNVTDLNTSTSWMNQPGATQVFNPAQLNQGVQLRYGRIALKNVSTYGGEVNTSWSYQYYNADKEWVVNSDHNSTGLGQYYWDQSIHTGVDLTDNGLKGGVVSVTLKTSQKLPYSFKVHLAIDPWLWYNQKAKDYQPPIDASGNQNLDCFTHPCFIIEFLSNNSGWGGVSNQYLNQKGFNEKNNTIQTQLREQNGTQQQFQRVNW